MSKLVCGLILFATAQSFIPVAATELFHGNMWSAAWNLFCAGGWFAASVSYLQSWKEVSK